MPKQHFISVSYDEQPEIQCMPLASNEIGLGFSSEGIIWGEQADAQLYINDHDELMMKCIGNTHISIERSGRKYVLNSVHPMRILPQDIIRIGEPTPHSFNIHHIYRSRKPLTLSKHLSKIAMIAYATSMVMTCNIACNRPEPNNPTDEMQTCEPSETELTETDIQLYSPSTTGLIMKPVEELEQLIKNRDEFVDEMKSNLESENNEPSH